MLKQLSYADFLKLRQSSSRIAVYRELLADRLTPIAIVDSLRTEMQDGVLLESGLQHAESGCYSLIAFGSIAGLRVQQQEVVQYFNGQQTRHQDVDPCAILRQLLSQMACQSSPEILPYVCGAIGFLTYDAVRFFEDIPDRHQQSANLPEMRIDFYQTTLFFDHVHQTLIMSYIVDAEQDPEFAYQQAITQLDQIAAKIQQSSVIGSSSITKFSPEDVVPDLDDAAFMQLVNRAKDYITAGDAFQIVLSRCFRKTYHCIPFDIYRALRRVSPSPYMFYLADQERIILGASPEKLVSVQNREVAVNPIAGTRQHQATAQQDMAEELLQDPKEHAEHMMLVDLARNDLGVVCILGTVKIQELLKVRHYSHVSHLTSVVTGQLRPEYDALDALAATFPAGTLSGAPKIRAMQIIDELETSRREMYGGAICRFDYLGNLDSCIAIRMAVLQDNVACVRTGAGIVYDSSPIAEANETRLKAQAMLAAIQFAEEGLG